jgi:hypothetical protein
LLIEANQLLVLCEGVSKPLTQILVDLRLLQTIPGRGQDAAPRMGGEVVKLDLDDEVSIQVWKLKSISDKPLIFKAMGLSKKCVGNWPIWVNICLYWLGLRRSIFGKRRDPIVGDDTTLTLLMG